MAKSLVCYFFLAIRCQLGYQLQFELFQRFLRLSPSTRRWSHLKPIIRAKHHDYGPDAHSIHLLANHNLTFKKMDKRGCQSLLLEKEEFIRDSRAL